MEIKSERIRVCYGIIRYGSTSRQGRIRLIRVCTLVFVVIFPVFVISSDDEEDSRAVPTGPTTTTTTPPGGLGGSSSGRPYQPSPERGRPRHDLTSRRSLSRAGPQPGRDREVPPSSSASSHLALSAQASSSPVRSGQRQQAPRARASYEDESRDRLDQVVPRRRRSPPASRSTRDSPGASASSLAPLPSPLPPLSAHGAQPAARRPLGSPLRQSERGSSSSTSPSATSRRRRRVPGGSEEGRGREQVVPRVPSTALFSLPSASVSESSTSEASQARLPSSRLAASLLRRRRVRGVAPYRVPQGGRRPEPPYPFPNARPFLFPLPPPPPPPSGAPPERIPGAGGPPPADLYAQILARAVAASSWNVARTAPAPLLASAALVVGTASLPPESYALPFRSLRLINPDVNPPQRVPSELVTASVTALLPPALMTRRLDHRGALRAGPGTPILVVASPTQMSRLFDRVVPSVPTARSPPSPPPPSPPAVLPPPEED